MNINLKIKKKDEHQGKINNDIKHHTLTSSSIDNNDLSKSDETIKKMLKISLICFCFLIAELIGGFIANSLAILSDAAHLSSDLSGFVISLFSLYISKKRANSKFTFGYHRAEVIGALISVITIWVLTGILIKEAIDRLINPSEINSIVMLMTSIFGLICNLMMFKVLHSTHHHHGCNHQDHCGSSANNHDNILNIIDDFKETLENSKEDANIIEENSSSLSIFNNGEEFNNKDSFISTENDKRDKDSDGKEHIQECKNHNHSIHMHHKKKIKCHKTKAHRHNSNDHLNKYHHEDHHDNSHSHSQENDHLHTDHFHSHHEDNVNIKAALIHILGDIIQSIGVVVAAIIIYFRPDLIIFDPICTFIFSFIVLITTYKITKQCVLILMEAVPPNLKPDSIKRTISKNFSDIKSIHSMQIWSLSTGKNCISFHAVIEEKQNKKLLIVDLTKFLKSIYKFQETVIQIETSIEFKILNCA